MDDVTRNAQSLARHDRILAHARVMLTEAAETPTEVAFAREMIAAAPAATPPAMAPATVAAPGSYSAAPAAAPAAAATVLARTSQPPAPTLSADQLDLLAGAFAPTEGMPEDAPYDSRPQPIADGAPELSSDQAALLMASFGTPAAANAGSPFPPGADAATGIPVASNRSRSLFADTVPADALAANLAALPPDQQALLAASFGVTGAYTLPHRNEREPDAATPLPVSPTPRAPAAAASAAAAIAMPPAAPAGELHFFSLENNRSPAAAAAASANASDAYLRTIRAVNGRVGAFGADGR